MNACSEESNESLCSDWYPEVRNRDNFSHHKRLEREYQSLQASYFDLSAEISRLKIFLRQVVKAGPRGRNQIIHELKNKIVRDVDTISQVHDDCLPTLQQHDMEMGDLKMRQQSLMQMLREQVGSLEKASEGITPEVRTVESSADCKPLPEGEAEKSAEKKPEKKSEDLGRSGLRLKSFS